MILDFGKHKGTELEDAPLPYIIFLAGYKMNGTRRIHSDLKGCIWVKQHKTDINESANAYLSDKCWHCGNKIMPIGSSRSNGAAHNDWDGRYLHKKCWRELKEEEEEFGSDS